MDSRDSSSTSSAVTGDSGSLAYNGGLLSVTATLAQESAVLFNSGNYGECLGVLTQLLLHRKQADPKVLHNIALAEFFRDGCLEPKKFLQELINIKKKCEDLACAAAEQVDYAQLPGNRTSLGPKDNPAGHQSSGASSNGVVYLSEFNASLTTLNMAIMLYHLHDYSKAMSFLELLFQNIEPLDEVFCLQHSFLKVTFANFMKENLHMQGIALHVCLLLLDLAVYTRDAAKFADVINYVEKAIGVSCVSNQADNGSMTQCQLSSMVSKTSSVLSNSTITDDLNAGFSANASESSLSGSFSDDAIEYETLLSSLDIGVGGVKKYSQQPQFPASSNLSQALFDQPSFVDLKLKIPLYKVQLLLLIRNLKVAKRELKLAMNISRGRDSSSALLLKSQLELARGNYVKAEKLLKASHSSPETGNSIIFNNNMGCIFFQWGKFQTSGVFLRRALLGCSSLRKEKPRNITTISQDKTLLIMYNSGLQYLACGKPVLAAQCFQKASLVFHHRPLLWIRLAECCLMALERGMVKSFDVAVIGRGKWRHLALINGFEGNGPLVSSVVNEKLKGPDLSMTFARQCLLNALELVRRFEAKLVKSGSSLKQGPEENGSSEGVVSLKNLNHKNSNGSIDSKGVSKDNTSLAQANANGDTKEQKGGGSNVSVSDYVDTCRREHSIMKQAILADLAFVELELGNTLVALSWARTLLQSPKCSRMYAFLARLYAAESLCLLNRPEEAAEQLLVYFSSGNVELPYSKDDCERWHSQWSVDKPVDHEESDPGYGYGLGLEHPKGHRGGEWQDGMFRKPEEAVGVLYLNLAAMRAMKGELEKAGQYASKALSLTPNSREANLMGIYLDLKQGKVEEARLQLRRCSCVTFVSSGCSRSKGYL